MKILLGLGHVARYAVGAGLSWLLFPIEAVVIYVALLILAGVSGENSGGPLAGPFLILLAALLGAAVTLLATLPAILIGDLIARRTRWFAAPVVALAVTLVLLTGYVWGCGVAVDSTAGQTAIALGVIIALSIIPLLAFGVFAYSSGAALAWVARRGAGRPGQATPGRAIERASASPASTGEESLLRQ